MSCITNYEAVSDYVGDWLHRAQVSLLTSQIKLNHIRKKPWCGPDGPGAGLMRAGVGLVRAWCGPGVGLVRAWCALACEGLLCQTHHPRTTRITRKLNCARGRNRAPCGVRSA